MRWRDGDWSAALASQPPQLLPFIAGQPIVALVAIELLLLTQFCNDCRYTPGSQ